MTELGTIDRETGAPATLRAVIGGISKPEDRLAELQKVYDTVIPDPEDKTNFLFVSPKTGRLTAYNPSGLDLGDVASMAREGTQAVAATAGATAGAPLGLPGIAGGSVLGGMAGEELFQLVLRGMGVQDTRSTQREGRRDRVYRRYKPWWAGRGGYTASGDKRDQDGFARVLGGGRSAHHRRCREVRL